MTDDDLLSAALGDAPDEAAPRRRRGGHQAGERSRLPQQRPWAQPRLHYPPSEVLSADQLESIHEASLRVLAEIGMDFLDADAREVLQAAGARRRARDATRPVRPGDGRRDDPDGARPVHAARPESRLTTS